MTTPQPEPYGLVQWQRGQLDEDERTARAATPGPWEWKREDGEPWQSKAGGWLDYSGEYLSAPGERATLFGPGMTPHADAVHIAAHDPARVLREIDAKRQILAEHAPCRPTGRPNMEKHCQSCTTAQAWDDVANESNCQTLRLLALPCADRPGYREEWRP